MIKSRLTRGFMLVVLVALQIVVPNSLEAGELLGRIHRLFGEAVYKGTEPCAAQDGAIECLAENIDWLEHHIDTYGSIVAKQPDIWGEARLTKHRDEYERILFRELNQFSQTINAAIAQGDSSFLSQALALSAAASAPTITPAPAEGQAAAGAASATPSAVTANAQLRGAAGVTPGFSRFVTMPDEPFISLEPVTHLDQMSRYLKHLHELRRINEGDDTSDSPGYSLNLVRIPVSVLPGKLTREGFGAEITITAEPLISDDLLPTTFRNLAVNDAADFLGLPLVRVTERLDEDGLRANETKLILGLVSRICGPELAQVVSQAGDTRRFRSFRTT